MKRLVVCIMCCAMGILSFSQDRCGVMPRDPEKAERFEGWLKDKQREKRAIQSDQRTQAEIYYIPVVFHIIHQGEAVGFGDNIPTQRILDQVDVLNEDFRKLNRRRDTGVPSAFSSVEADIEVEFVLARQDPDGLPTDGIVRLQGTKTQYSFPGTDLKALSYWPSEDYLNIWVAETGDIIGWASFPETDLDGFDPWDAETNPERDGVVLDDDFIGINDNTDGSFDSYGQTLTHEIGHFLGLLHVWGDGGCSQDDFCTDTPTMGTHHGNFGTEPVIAPCTFLGGPDTCTDDSEQDMFMNFMDYTDDTCLTMFTLDQRSRIRTVLENSPRRLSLTTSHGLEPPLGTLEYDMALLNVTNIPIVTCESTVQVDLEVRNVGNQTVTDFLLEYSLNGSTQSEIFTGLNLALGDITTVNFSLNLAEEGAYNLSWDMTEVNGITDENTINNSASSFTILNTDELPSPFREDFESGVWATNSIEGTSEWQSIQSTGESSLTVNAFESTTEVESWLVSPIFSLEDFQESGLFFKMSYGINSIASANDRLSLLVSRSCNDDFTEVWTRNLGLLDFEETTSSWPLEPKEEWLEQFIDLSEFAGETELRLAFVFQNNGGNNFFLDDIELTNNSDKDQPRLEEGKAVAYPNPARESFKVTLNLPESQEVAVQLVDISGSVVIKERYADILNQTLTFQTGSLYGTYFLIIKGKDINKIQRVLIGR